MVYTRSRFSESSFQTWTAISDISIEFTSRRPIKNLQLKVCADVNKKYALKRDGERKNVIRPALNERMYVWRFLDSSHFTTYT